MTALPENAAPERSYGCSNGDGNPYDFIVVTVSDATTQFLCTPCFVQAAIVMVTAITEGQDPEVMEAVASAGVIDQVPMNEGRIRQRGKNAPAELENDLVIERFDNMVLENEFDDE